MTKRAKIWSAVGGAGLVAVLLFLGTGTMCACTPALNPVPPPPEFVVALDTLARHQESYYRKHGRYTDSLELMGLAHLFVAWNPRFPIANGRGFDLILSADSMSCTYLVRRVTDDTTVGRRLRCYSAS